MRWLPSILLGFVACASSPPPPEASTSAGSDPAVECRHNPHLPRLRQLMDELRFDEAADLAQRALESPDNCKEDLAEIYRIKAELDSING